VSHDDPLHDLADALIREVPALRAEVVALEAQVRRRCGGRRVYFAKSLTSDRSDRARIAATAPAGTSAPR
jgi:type VI protein secretion system component VasF